MMASSSSLSSDDDDGDKTCTATTEATTANTTTRSRILFGSCNSQAYTQPLWSAVVERNASAFVWAGDAIYADVNLGHDLSRRSFPYFPRTIHDHATPERLAALYEQQRQDDGYKALLRQHTCFITGTWDDHDYGTNNGDSTFPMKRESAIAFVKFLGEPKDSPMSKRARSGHGVYGVKLIDFERPFGQQVLTEEQSGLDPDVDDADEKQFIPYSNKSVAIFVLDVRSWKTPWTANRTLDPHGDFLGERQWTWFQQALGRSHAAINIVVNGLQVHADRHPNAHIAESWSRFPTAQQRLYDVLLQHDHAPSILVSGDVHMAELMRKDCRRRRFRKGDGSLPRRKSLVEVTTSGMTHSWGTSFCSRPTSNFLCRYAYANWVLKQSMHFAHYINPLNDIIIDDHGKMLYSLDLNFAEFDFDWDNNSVSVGILGQGGVTLLTAQWSLDDLNRGLPGSQVRERDYLAVERSQQELGLPQSEWTCVNYRGVAHPYHRPFALTLTFLMPITMLLGPIIVALVVFIVVIKRLVTKMCQRR